MEDHVPGVVVEGEVVLGEGGLAAVEGSLVAQGIGAVTQSSGHVDNGAEIQNIYQNSGLGREFRSFQQFWCLYPHDS